LLLAAACFQPDRSNNDVVIIDDRNLHHPISNIIHFLSRPSNRHIPFSLLFGTLLNIIGK